MAAKMCSECMEPTTGSGVVHRECFDSAIDELQDEIEALYAANRDRQVLDPFDALLHELRYCWLPNYRVMCDA